MKPQDILILLYLLTRDEEWTQVKVAEALNISTSEVSNALNRCVETGLMDTEKRRINKLALREFLLGGIKYAFPAKPGTEARGIATAHSASPIKEHIAENGPNYVWPYYKGTRRGFAVEPLYKTVPQIISNQPKLYEYLVIVDALRTGKVREVEAAIEELDKRLNA